MTSVQHSGLRQIKNQDPLFQLGEVKRSSRHSPIFNVMVLFFSVQCPDSASLRHIEHALFMQAAPLGQTLKPEELFVYRRVARLAFFVL